MAKLKPIEQNEEVKEHFNSRIADLLGYTKEYLEKVSGSRLPNSIHELATEIGLVSAKLNALCTKFDKLVSQQKVLEVHRKQVEWAQMIADHRKKKVDLERKRIGKKLRGADKKHYRSTGKLPSETFEELKAEFLKRMLEMGAQLPDKEVK